MSQTYGKLPCSVKATDCVEGIKRVKDEYTYQGCHKTDVTYTDVDMPDVGFDLRLDECWKQCEAQNKGFTHFAISSPKQDVFQCSCGMTPKEKCYKADTDCALGMGGVDAM